MLQHLHRHLRATDQASGSHFACELPLYDAVLDGILGPAGDAGKVNLLVRSTADPAGDIDFLRLEALRSGDSGVSRVDGAYAAGLHRVPRAVRLLERRRRVGRPVPLDSRSTAGVAVRAVALASRREDGPGLAEMQCRDRDGSSRSSGALRHRLASAGNRTDAKHEKANVRHRAAPVEYRGYRAGKDGRVASDQYVHERVRNVPREDAVLLPVYHFAAAPHADVVLSGDCRRLDRT